MDFPEELIESHDLTVDYILTPTRVIETNCQLPKPQGIIWSKVKLNFSLLSVLILKVPNIVTPHAYDCLFDHEVDVKNALKNRTSAAFHFKSSAVYLL